MVCYDHRMFNARLLIGLKSDACFPPRPERRENKLMGASKQSIVTFYNPALYHSSLAISPSD